MRCKCSGAYAVQPSNAPVQIVRCICSAAGYIPDKSNIKDKKFLRFLEARASDNQRTTIAKPSSVVSGSSYSVPISYYDQTTSYGFDLIDENGYNEFVDFDDFGEVNIGHNDSFEPAEIVQAFNSFVKIPRPKYENSPSNILTNEIRF